MANYGTKPSVLRTLFCISWMIFGSSAEVMRNGILNQLGLHGLENNNTATAELESLISNLFEDQKDDLVRRAEKALGGWLPQSTETFNVSDACLKHTETFLEALLLKQDWAFRMIDSMGKPPSGLLNGNLVWLGSYDECLAIRVDVNDTSFTGRYCTAAAALSQIPVLGSASSLSIGLCVPSSCDSNDTTALLNTLLSLFPMNTSALPKLQVKCQIERIELDTKAKIVIGVTSLFGLVMLVATIYDVIVSHWAPPKQGDKSKYEVMKDDCVTVKVTKFSHNNYGTTESLKSIDDRQDMVQRNGVSKYDLEKVSSQGNKEQKYEPGKLGKVLLSFSVYTNASKILNTNQPKGTLTAVNGIRFLSMTWVIMGHSFGASMGFAENVATFSMKMLKRFTFQAISNATVSVDTFFTLSGLLVSYLCLKEMKKMKGARKFNWGMFYFHRFWRLTPPYMLFLMFYVCLEKYWSDGPIWPQEGTEIDDCKDSWWRNLLYVNNLIKPREQCMGWGWYLANDMQFYVVSPLMLIPLYYSKILGTLSCSAFLLVSIISTAWISVKYDFGASILGADQTKGIEYYEKLYVKPWCRIGPYAIGFFTGYILYRTECKIKFPKLVTIFGWIAATAIALLVLYGLYDSKTGFPNLSTNLSAFYSSTHRSAWGLAVCWVILACATGHGGFINTLLSWKALIPLSRLTYCAYLVHMVVMDVYQNSKRSLVYFSDLEEIYMFLGHVSMSYATAFVVSLTFEAPMMGLEKAILGRGKNS